MVKILKGDATIPISCDKPVIIAHVCNNVNAWGRGFVVPLGAKYPQAKTAFHNASKEYSSDELLGKVQLVKISSTLAISNMFAQNGLRSKSNSIPLRMDSLEQCLTSVFKIAANKGAVIQMPRIGAGLAGGSWSEIFELINKLAFDWSVECYILEIE